MVNVVPITLSNGIAIGISVEYPKTTLLSITTSVGYIMCGVLNIDVLDTLHSDRQIIAARITGVKKLEELLDGRIVESTKKAREIGIEPGMTGKEALEKMMEISKRRLAYEKRCQDNPRCGDRCAGGQGYLRCGHQKG